MTQLALGRAARNPRARSADSCLRRSAAGTSTPVRATLIVLAGVAGLALAVTSRLHAAAPPPKTPTADKPRVETGAELLLTSGSFQSATLVECLVPQRLAVKSAAATETIDWPRVVRWGSAADLPRELGPSGRNAVVCLADGGWLVAEEASFDRQAVRWRSAILGAVEAPRSRVRGLLFSLPADPRQRDLLWDRGLQGETAQDRVLLGNGDEVVGAARSLQNDRLQCDVAAQPISVPLARVVAVLFRREGVADRSDRPAAIAGFADGSRVMISSASGKGDVLSVTPVGLAPLKAALSDLVFLQSCSPSSQGSSSQGSSSQGSSSQGSSSQGSSSQGSQGGQGSQGVEYLSDRKPLVYRHVPFLSIAWPYRDDRCVSGGMLRAGGRMYAKGLGVHSAARLEYAVPEHARQFQAEAAIDDSALAAGGGSVRFRVFVDGQAKYAGAVVRGGDPPVPIRVDVAGAKRVDLVVDFADRGDQGDRADWLDARFVR